MINFDEIRMIAMLYIQLDKDNTFLAKDNDFQN